MRTEDDIKKYLFDEMTATERDEFEAEMFANDELFFETVDHENRLEIYLSPVVCQVSI